MDKEAARIIVKLARHRYWGGRHTSIDNLPKGAPRERWEYIRKLIKELIAEGFLLTKPTHDGIHVSLNPKMKKEIYRIVEEYKE